LSWTCVEPPANRSVEFNLGGNAHPATATVNTGPTGVASITVTDETAETVTVTATADGVSAKPVSLVFSPTPPKTAQMALTLSAYQVEPGQPVNATVVVLDPYGQPLTGRDATVIVTDVATSAVVTTLTCTTGAGGSCLVPLPSTVAGSFTVMTKLIDPATGQVIASASANGPLVVAKSTPTPTPTPSPTPTPTPTAATPALEVTSSGRVFTFTGSGFGSGESVTATIHSTPISLGSQPATASGTVVFTWTAPSDFSGNHQVVLAGASGQVSGWFVVPPGAVESPTAPVTSSSTQGARAPTGGTAAGSVSWLLVAAASVLGLGLLAGWRMRRSAYTGHRAR